MYFTIPILLNNNLKGIEFITDTTGKITGYTTKIGGADAVFPFKGSGTQTFTFQSTNKLNNQMDINVSAPIYFYVIIDFDNSTITLEVNQPSSAYSSKGNLYAKVVPIQETRDFS